MQGKGGFVDDSEVIHDSSSALSTAVPIVMLGEQLPFHGSASTRALMPGTRLPPFSPRLLMRFCVSCISGQASDTSADADESVARRSSNTES